MFIQVKLLQGFKEPLLYEVPSDWNSPITVGSFVKVPLRNKVYSAFVEDLFSEKPPSSFFIKKALSIEQVPSDRYYFQFITKLADYYQTEPVHFIKRIRHFLLQKEESDTHHTTLVEQNLSPFIELTDEQHNIVSFMKTSLQNSCSTPTLLHGVTGSGKTEVYKKLIEQTLQMQKTAILLLPEVSLSLQFMHLLKSHYNSSIPIVSFHSGTTLKEKKQVWTSLLAADPLLIIGVHLPLLLPIQNLGLIIVDEEHETGYQEKKHPKINSKEAALLRSQIAHVPILLGSATPSISSLYNVKNKGWNFFQLKKRFSGIFPSITVVHLPNKKERKNFWISKELEQALHKQLQKKEQTLIFLNRRGFSFFVQCKSCSFIFYCSSCSVSLTLHENNTLLCHYCGFIMKLTNNCTSCKSEEFLKKGIGTQHIVQILQKIFPQAKIARADLDVTTNKKLWQKTIDEFQAGTIDILVGTQTITKGYHFPKVSLVGIIWADLNLHFPIYNAVETTLQQLIQVAGRAGRSGLQSNVIVQTMDNHEIFSYLNELDYLKFYHNELENRTLVGYPPSLRLAEIELKNSDETILEREVVYLAKFLHNEIKKRKLEIHLLGPTKPPIAKIKNWHSRKMYIKSSNIHNLILLFGFIDKNNYKSFLFFTPNPVN
jgi:primosomal protein N' (replication factor Y) (superfamily II helicase)